MLAFTIRIHVKSTEATLTTFIIFRFIISNRFLRLPKKVTSLILAHLECAKILFFLFNFCVIKAWKFCKSFLACRFVLKSTKIRKVKWFLTTLFLCNFNWTIIKICLVTKLREIDWLLIFILWGHLCRSSFFLSYFFIRSCWIEWISNNWKRRSIHRISLRTWNILKLIKIKALIGLSVFDRKFPTLIDLVQLFRIINLRFIFCHSFERVLNGDIFGFVFR